MTRLVIGKGPDFVMRMDATTYSHHFSVTSSLLNGNTMSESISRSSLHAVLKELKQKLLPKGWSPSTQINWDNSKGLFGSYESKNGTITIQYHLISSLALHQRLRLQNEIVEAFKPIF